MNFSLLLFITGILGFILNRKNIILMIISIEIMLLAVTLLILISSYNFNENFLNDNNLKRVKFTVGTVVDLQNLSLPGFNSFLTLLFFNFSFITLLQYQYFSPAEREWDEETDKKLLSLLLAHPSRTGPVRSKITN